MNFKKNMILFLTIASLLKIHLSFEQNGDNGQNGDALNFLSSEHIQPDYDMYVFSIQWGRTLCNAANNKCIERLKTIPKNIFTLHGLWPSYSDGKQISKCNSGQEIKIVRDTSDIFTEMGTYWISYTHDDDSFWSHEYNTHGYCYTQKYNTQDPKKYFQYALEIYRRHDMGRLFLKAFGDLSGSHSFDFVDLSNHLKRITGDLQYELVCRHYNKKQYLQEIRFRFDLDLRAMEFKQRGECNLKDPVYVDFQ